MSRTLVIFGIIVCSIAAIAARTVQMTICNCVDEDDRFTKIGNNHYIILKHKFNWFQAADFCRANDADLASIQSRTELQAISDYLLGANFKGDDWFWIDGNDLGKEGAYMSIATGLPMVFMQWSPGQPDNSGGAENCMHLWRSVGQFQMNDCSCQQLSYAICKKRKNSSVMLNTL